MILPHELLVTVLQRGTLKHETVVRPGASLTVGELTSAMGITSIPLTSRSDTLFRWTEPEPEVIIYPQWELRFTSTVGRGVSRNYWQAREGHEAPTEPVAAMIDAEMGRGIVSFGAGWSVYFMMRPIDPATLAEDPAPAPPPVVEAAPDPPQAPPGPTRNPLTIIMGLGFLAVCAMALARFLI